MKFLNNLDLAKNELQNAVIQRLASAPSTPLLGQLYYNTTDNNLYVFDNVGWVDLTVTATGGGDAATLNAQTPAFYLSRTNHTGTQTAATVSDLATVVKAYRLDEFAVPTADVNVNSRKITSLANPTAANDAANKSYVDALVQGIAPKESVRAATTATITLSGVQTIDGISIIANDRVLVKNQATGSANGIYVASATAWARATDADSATDLASAYAFVEEGTVNANTGWLMVTDAVTLETTSLVFTQFSGAGTYTAGTGLALTGGVFSSDTANGYGLRKISATIGDGTATSIAVTHNIGTRDVQITVYEVATPFATVYPNIERNTTAQATLVFSIAPTASQYRVVVIG